MKVRELQKSWLIPDSLFCEVAQGGDGDYSEARSKQSQCNA